MKNGSCGCTAPGLISQNQSSTSILYMIYGKSQKSLNFLCFCGYYNRQMSAKYYNGQILKNIFLYNYIAG